MPEADQKSMRQQVDGLWQQVCDDFKTVEMNLGGFDRSKMCDATDGSVIVFKSKFPDVSADEILTITRELRDFIDPLFTRLVALASTGIVVSFCEHDRMRTFALELGLSTMQANSDPTARSPAVQRQSVVRDIQILNRPTRC
jgi:hypothetical protein